MRDNAMRRSVANELVTQPERVADAREAEMLTSAFAESQRATEDRSESCVDTDRFVPPE